MREEPVDRDHLHDREQRRTNYALAAMSEDEFMEAVTQGKSVASMDVSFAANRNRENRELLSDDAHVPSMSLEAVISAQGHGAVVVDGRRRGRARHGAQPISLPSLFSRLDELDATAPTAVFCAGANALPSPRACCDHAGFVDVLDLVGGHNAWAARTQDLTTTAGAK